MIRRINHVQITIPKGTEDDARDFYCRVLGLPEIAKPDSLAGRGGFWVGIGDQQIHVGTEDGFDRLTTKAHIAYEVDDITFWRERVQSGGAQIADSVPIPGFERFEAALQAHSPNGAAAVRDALLAAVSAHTGARAADDDRTLLILTLA